MYRRALPWILACVALLAGRPCLAERQLEVEPNHTSVGFSIPIAGGLTRVTGKFTDFAISLTFTGEDPLTELSGWSLAATISAASIDTGIDARDRHLRTADFFDVESHPEIRFSSSRVEGTGPDYVAIGELTMHGITRPLSLPLTITGKIDDQVAGSTMVGAVARMQLLRSDYDIATDFRHRHMEEFLGDEVEVEIFGWLRPPKPNEAGDDARADR
jgi:polyisoprenoid-binding protein YceI